MKCQHCEIKIDSSFTFSIKKNQCPRCGEHIMDHKKLASYFSLQSLLESNFSDIDCEKIANLIIANFELKQLFKEDIDSSDKNNNSSDNKSIEKKSDKKEEEEVDLQKLRDEALNEATVDHFKLGEANGLVEDNMRLEKERRANNIATGSRGAFRRSS